MSTQCPGLNLEDQCVFFVWKLTLDLCGLGDPGSSCATTGIANEIGGSHDPHFHDKADKPPGRRVCDRLLHMRSGSSGCVPVAVMWYWAFFPLAPFLVLYVSYCLVFSPRADKFVLNF